MNDTTKKYVAYVDVKLRIPVLLDESSVHGLIDRKDVNETLRPVMPWIEEVTCKASTWRERGAPRGQLLGVGEGHRIRMGAAMIKRDSRGDGYIDLPAEFAEPKRECGFEDCNASGTVTDDVGVSWCKEHADAAPGVVQP